MHVNTIAILPMLIAAIAAVGLLAGGGWIVWRLARTRPALMIPIAVCGLLSLAGFLIVGLYSVRMESSEAVLRAQKQNELETLAAALHGDRSRPPVFVVEESSDGAASQVLDWRGDPEDEPEAGVDDSATQPADGDNPSLELVAYVGGDVVGQRLTELPEWVDDAPETHRLIDESREVLVSDQWATLEEADAQLTNLASIKLANYLAAQYPSAAGWMPDADTIAQSGAVTRRLHETSTLPIGEFNPSMYRMYWELELTPDVRARLLEAWRPFAVQQRVTWLAIGIGVLTLVFTVVGSLLRRGPRQRPRHRSVGPATVAAVLVATGASLVMLG